MNPSLQALKELLEALQTEDGEKIRDAMDRGQAVYDFEEQKKADGHTEDFSLAQTADIIQGIVPQAE